MTPEQFAYWLQGHAELTPGGGPPTAAQWAIIRAHLDTVFKNVTAPKVGYAPKLGPIVGQAKTPGRDEIADELRKAIERAEQKPKSPLAPLPLSERPNYYLGDHGQEPRLIC